MTSIEKQVEKEYTHLDVRKVVSRGKLIYASEFGRTLKKIPPVKKDNVLVGLVCKFIGNEAYTVVIDDNETYKKWKDSFGQSWFPAGAIGHLYSFPKKLIPKFKIIPENSVVQLDTKEIIDLSKKEGELNQKYFKQTSRKKFHL